MSRLFRRARSSAGLLALLAACSTDESPTSPASDAQLAKGSTRLKVTPPEIDLPGTGEKATLTVSSAFGPIAVAVSTPACVSVALRSTQQNQSKYTVTATAAGSCVLTVTDGATGQVQVPVEVAATLLPNTLAAGTFHTCGLDGNGAAYCWGFNGSGQLGNTGGLNSPFANSTPVPVDGGIAFASLTGGGDHTCGLTPTGAAFCWGLNRHGQLGNPTNSGEEFADNATPLPVTGNLTFSMLEAGGDHTCGITAAGVMYCWGKNWQGQLGTTTNNGTNTPNPTPAQVSGNLTFIAVGAGTNHTCGVVSGGAVYCWGDNSKGQSGHDQGLNNSLASHPTPTQVPGISLASLAAGGHFTCGLTPAGAAWCWGDNLFGELSGTTDGISTVPVPVSGGLSFISLGAGGGHTCGLTGGRTLYCWGANLLGQLGTTSNFGTSTPSYSPSPVAGLSLAAVAVNAAHTCGLTAAGQAWCWGFNRYGQLGTATNNNTDTGVPSPGAVTGSITFAVP